MTHASTLVLPPCRQKYAFLISTCFDYSSGEAREEGVALDSPLLFFPLRVRPLC